MTHDLDKLAAGLTEPRFDGRGNTIYRPCDIGLHLCGIAGDPEQPYTAANLPASSHAEARAMFEAAKEEASCGAEESDFILDLNLGGPDVGCEHVDDFCTNRQLWPRLQRAALRHHLLAKDPA